MTRSLSLSMRVIAAGVYVATTKLFEKTLVDYSKNKICSGALAFPTKNLMR